MWFWARGLISYINMRMLIANNSYHMSTFKSLCVNASEHLESKSNQPEQIQREHHLTNEVHNAPLCLNQLQLSVQDQCCLLPTNVLVRSYKIIHKWIEVNLLKNVKFWRLYNLIGCSMISEVGFFSTIVFCSTTTTALFRRTLISDSNLAILHLRLDKKNNSELLAPVSTIMIYNFPQLNKICYYVWDPC